MNNHPENPFSAPISSSESDGLTVVESKKEEESFGSRAKKVFLSWEKLRIVYNMVLVGVSLLVGFVFLGSEMASIEFWILALEGAVVSNVCFFAGPVVESYVGWLGFRWAWLRISLFMLGLLFTAFVAIVSIASLGFAQLQNP